MLLARVVGNIVATKKDPRLEGRKLLVIQPVSPAGELKVGTYLVALDTVGAGAGDIIFAVQGSSARMSEGMQDIPVDAAVVGIVDEVDIEPPRPPATKKRK